MILKVKKILQILPNNKTFQFIIGDENNSQIYSNANVRNHMRTLFGNQAFLYENDYETETETEVANTFYDLWKDYCDLNEDNWNRAYLALYSQYNPIQNYNREETETIETTKENDVDTNDYLTGVTTETTYGKFKTETTVQTYQDGDKTENAVERGHIPNAKDSETTTGKTEYTKSYGDKTETRTNNTAGNIGVMSTQDMINQELEVRKINLFYQIVDGFIRMYCFTHWGCES